MIPEIYMPAYHHAKIGPPGLHCPQFAASAGGGKGPGVRQGRGGGAARRGGCQEPPAWGEVAGLAGPAAGRSPARGRSVCPRGNAEVLLGCEWEDVGRHGIHQWEERHPKDAGEAATKP